MWGINFPNSYYDTVSWPGGYSFWRAKLLNLGYRYPLRYFPVYDFFNLVICSGVPQPNTYPPSLPPFGPRSIIWSAHFKTSRLCSITITVCPLFINLWKI